MISRRDFIKWSAAAGTWVYVSGLTGAASELSEALGEPIPGGTLDPLTISKFATPLLVPPVMPRAGVVTLKNGKTADYYEISVRQFKQQILPAGLPATTVWGYGAVRSASRNGLLLHHAPSLTIEALAGRPVRVKWINDLKDRNGRYLPHLLPVDPTLHWANPPGGTARRDSRPTFSETPTAYRGPVPIVTHVHGAVGVADDSDGYAEAWFLPAAKNIPPGYARKGTWYDFFSHKAFKSYGTRWGAGYSVFQYPNANRASTVWYHDHALGMTRLNVYAGPAGFYLIRGGSSGDAAVKDSRSGLPAVLPGPAPRAGDRFPSRRPYCEIPIAIQDRAFNNDGSLFYPDSRTFFDGVEAPYIPQGGEEGFSPIWNPEYFGNTLMVNGNTWPYQTVERRRYRFRFLNGCQSRFLILDFARIPGIEVWQIGNEGGLLPAPYNVTVDGGNRMLMGLAERADVIVDFTNVLPGNYVLHNVGPDEPFGGGEPGTDFVPSDADTTGQVMQFRVVAAKSADLTTPPQYLRLPWIRPLPKDTVTRSLAAIEMMGMGEDADGEDVEGPVEAVLGTVGPDLIDAQVPEGVWTARMWSDEVTENPAVGATELWEIYNTTGDAHPMHVHEVVFEVVNRQQLKMTIEDEVASPIELVGLAHGPEPWEKGFKDTVIAYPGQVTRIKARFSKGGQFTWHCHIVEHEDNEMMRPYRIGPKQPGQPNSNPM